MSEEPTRRVSARTQIAQQWASRRQEATQQPANTTNTTKSRPRRHSASNTTVPISSTVPSLCYVIGKAWQEALANLTNTLQPKSPGIKTSSKTSPKNSANKEKGKTSLVAFPSVLQILKANALHEQISKFGDPTSLSILPTNYNWNQAILEMAASRSRAFLLLDLSSLVPTLVDWKRHTPTTKLKFLYTVQSNADPHLLQLLVRSKIGLVCSNKWDLIKCRQALQQEDDDPNDGTVTSKQSTKLEIYDNAAITGKPDGYLRQLILDAGVDTVVIDGPAEVARIGAAVQRMQQRRNVPGNSLTLKFILRLPTDINEWMGMVQSTQEELEKQNRSSALTGISLDVTNKYSAEIQSQVELVLEQMDSTNSNGIRLDLTGVTMPPDHDTKGWWNTLANRPGLQQITFDISEPLISPAGALCTRIIGVKEEDVDNGNGKRMHYYIDDGCYGSLYHAAQHGTISHPLPLVYNDDNDDNVKDNSDIDNKEQKMWTSTVWGPTCDGLDRVCRDIPLPKLKRDQWLVFPNLGFVAGEGLGTAFNGFAPPDTAYCVLGYFGKQ